MLEIISIPALKDNYIWLGINHDLKQAFVVDPGDATPVFAYLDERKISLTDILLTHKHADHTAGVKDLVAQFPQVNVYAHELEGNVFTNHFVQDGEKFQLAVSKQLCSVIHIPGHTHGHVAYYLEPALFCGDTLFSAGCGRIFEGTAEQMFHSLEKLRCLPDETLVYCGHEYTLNNLKFAARVEPSNTAIANMIDSVKKLIEFGKPSLPSILQLEKQINPFLRCKEKTVINAAEARVGKQLLKEVEVFHVVREWKNSF